MMNDNNDCDCFECKPKNKYKLIYLLPLSIIFFGLVTLSPATVICGIIISYYVKQNNALKYKLKNSKCWY